MRAVHINDQISYNMNTEVAIHVDPMIRAEALVYAYIYGDNRTGFKLDTMDTEINWFLNGKRVKPDGFRELYTKLYGKEALHKLQKDVCAEAGKLIASRVADKFKDIINDEIQ